MKTWSIRSRTAWIMPLVLLVVVLLEEIATYKVRQKVHDLYLRVAIILVLNAFAFVFAAGWLAPWIKGLFSRAHRGSKRAGGAIGLWFFYAVAYGAIFYAYLVVERRGIAGLLPVSWR